MRDECTARVRPRRSGVAASDTTHGLSEDDDAFLVAVEESEGLGDTRHGRSVDSRSSHDAAGSGTGSVREKVMGGGDWVPRVRVPVPLLALTGQAGRSASLPLLRGRRGVRRARHAHAVARQARDERGPIHPVVARLAEALGLPPHVPLLPVLRFLSLTLF